MTENKKCPECGAELTADAPAGICPKCLLGLEMRESQEDESGPDAPTLLPANPNAGQANDALPLGTKVRYLGDYEILEEIARGGMGVVFKARQTSLNRIVALKMILAGQLAGEDDVMRFHAEAEAVAQLDHPGIVPIFEVGEHEEQHYFSMAFVDGQSLTQKVSEGPLSPREAAGITIQVAEAIAYAHAHGVIHRDLKPSNVLLDNDGQPRVTDFGLAKRVGADSDLTATGQVLGTPSFMPPEQAGGKTEQIGPLSDVYSLGAILYYLLTAQPPFQAASAIETLMQVLEQSPVSPRLLNPKIPRDLETICLKCLDKEPSKRFASASELAEEIERFLAGDRIRSRRKRLEMAGYGHWTLGGGILLAPVYVLLSYLEIVPSYEDSRVFGGPFMGILWGAVFGLCAAGLWNSVVIPVCVFRQTRNPLVKVALGLNLVLVSFMFLCLALVLIFADIVLIFADIGPLTVPYWVPKMFLALGSLAGTLGPVFCLAIPPKSQAQGVLYGSVTLQISNLILGSVDAGEADIDVISGWIIMASFVLFLVFLKKLAVYVDAQEIVTRATSVLRLILYAIILIGSTKLLMLLTGSDLAGLAAIVLTIFTIVIGYKFLTLTRELYSVLLQKL